MNALSKNKIIILGGNPETGALVDVANSLGFYTIVLDPYVNSPSKRNAAKKYEVDIKNLNTVDEIIQNEGVSGVLVGVADPLVPYYEKICRRNSFHCYANEKIIKVLTSKSNFAQTCIAYGIAVTPSYKIDYSSESNFSQLAYPVVVKPVDAGAGVGISVCQNSSDLLLGIKHALNVSIRKELLIEKYMECDDMFAYYTFVDGVPYLSALADRYKTNKQGKFSSVCIAAEYPSRYINRFLNEIHPKLLAMFRDLEISNGVLLIQFFVDAENFYAYDPGFRLQGEAPHLYLKHINGFDQREMLIDFAMNGKMSRIDFNNVNDFRFKNKLATTIWILLRPGRICSISGLNELRNHPNVVEILKRFDVGDIVSPEMVGTERQVFARIYTISESVDDSSQVVRFINENMSITDEFGENMILDRYEKVQA